MEKNNFNEKELTPENADDKEPDDFSELLLNLVDDEDTSSGDANSLPWDPSKIRITTKHFSLRDVVDQISDNEIDLSPDFQRDYVWKQRQKTRLVESILLGIPLPAFYFNQDNDGTFQVVDGVQRLSTISLFMKDRHTLDRYDLEYLVDLHGLRYSELPPAALRRFRSTQIVVHVIEPQTPDEVKYDIFSRVNTLGSPLSAQEIRHAMSKGKSRHLLKQLSELPVFDKATGHQYWRRNPEAQGEWIRDTGRMTNRELVLRFFAFRNYSHEEYRHYPSLDAFLVEYTRRLDGCSERNQPVLQEEIHKLARDFQRAMENAHEILGRTAFRRWTAAHKRLGPINRAVFESQALAFADYSLPQLLQHKDYIIFEFKRVFEDQQYSRSVTVGTGNAAAISTRLNYTKYILKEIIK